MIEEFINLESMVISSECLKNDELVDKYSKFKDIEKLEKMIHEACEDYIGNLE